MLNSYYYISASNYRRYMNEFTLLGKTVGNIEIKTSESGTKYANLLLDVRRPYKNKEGEYEHDVISLTGFKNAADFLENVSEGSMLTVKGHISANSYTKDGRIFYSNSMIIDRADYVPTY